MEQNNMVNHPNHYGGEDNPYEVIKVCEAWELDKDAYLFNVVKYVARAGKKDPAKELEDLKKASWYLDRYINLIEKNQQKEKEESQLSFMDDPESRRWFLDPHRSA